MKYYNILIASLLTLSVTTACDKFLDVLPSTEKEKREMFSTLDGCRSVLIGAYIRMKQFSSTLDLYIRFYRRISEQI